MRLNERGTFIMIRSMYSGISGMKNFQTKLDVIGNNIANVNTYGFKKGRVTFKDMVNQTISGASGPSQGKGGINPQQVGLGSQLAAIDTIDTQGALQTTGRVLDLAIQGDGYLVVAEGMPSGETFFASSTYYTRAGNLYLNNDGYLVTSTGHYVMAKGENNDTLQPVHLNGGKVDEIQSFSISENGQISFIKTMGASEADKAMEISARAALAAKNITENPSSKKNVDLLNKLTQELEDAVRAAESEAKLLVADADAKVNIAASGDARKIAEAAAAKALADEADVKAQEIATVLADLLGSLPEIDVAFAAYQANPNSATEQAIVAAATNSLTNANNVLLASTNSSNSTAYAIDAIENISAKEIGLDREGNLYTTSASIALARFSNGGGLQKAGENMYTQTASSGNASYLAPGTEGSGMLVSGALEMSNVDLSEEFTEMIVAQRGFQANTRIITTSDEILQELVNLKR